MSGEDSSLAVTPASSPATTSRPSVAAEERGTWRVVFNSQESALGYLADRGFSVGRLQADADRGILLGDIDIQKWRNLRPEDRAALHGVLARSGRNGWAAVTIYGAAPAEAHAAIRLLDGQLDSVATRTSERSEGTPPKASPTTKGK